MDIRKFPCYTYFVSGFAVLHRIIGLVYLIVSFFDVPGMVDI